MSHILRKALIGGILGLTVLGVTASTSTSQAAHWRGHRGYYGGYYRPYAYAYPSYGYGGYYDPGYSYGYSGYAYPAYSYPSYGYPGAYVGVGPSYGWYGRGYHRGYHRRFR